MSDVNLIALVTSDAKLTASQYYEVCSPFERKHISICQLILVTCVFGNICVL